MTDSAELIQEVWHRRRVGLCVVQKKQEVFQEIVTPIGLLKYKREMILVRIDIVDHKNDRKDRDVCTECGEAMLHGKVNRRVKGRYLAPRLMIIK